MSTKAGTATPLDILLPYQRDWVDDEARFKVGLWARQTGKSFSTAAESVRDCQLRKTTWVTLSAGERQALEWLRKATEWAEAYSVATAGIVEDRNSSEALLMVGSADKCAKFFRIDGNTNELVHSTLFSDMPIAAGAFLGASSISPLFSLHHPPDHALRLRLRPCMRLSLLCPDTLAMRL